MPWRSRARGGAASTVPAASPDVDGAAVRLASLIVRCKGKNRSHAAGLGACRRRGSRRRRGFSHRGIGLGWRRPKLGGGARDRRAPVRSKRGPHGNRSPSRLVRQTVDCDVGAFSAGSRITPTAGEPPKCPFGAALLALCRRALYSRRLADRIYAPSRRDAVFQRITLFTGEDYFQ